jgi:hypothetical protein
MWSVAAFPSSREFWRRCGWPENEIEIVFIRTPNFEAKHPTTNIEHPTSSEFPNGELLMFDVGCWLLDVPK